MTNSKMERLNKLWTKADTAEQAIIVFEDLLKKNEESYKKAMKTSRGMKREAAAEVYEEHKARYLADIAEQRKAIEEYEAEEKRILSEAKAEEEAETAQIAEQEAEGGQMRLRDYMAQFQAAKTGQDELKAYYETEGKNGRKERHFINLWEQRNNELLKEADIIKTEQIECEGSYFLGPSFKFICWYAELDADQAQIALKRQGQQEAESRTAAKKAKAKRGRKRRKFTLD